MSSNKSLIPAGDEQNKQNAVAGILKTVLEGVTSSKPTEDGPNKQLAAAGLLRSVMRKSARPKDVRELGASVVKHLPTHMITLQSFVRAVDWRQAQSDIGQGLETVVAIVGQPNAGKSTLFNKIKGRKISAVSSEPGTTSTPVQSDFGPFTLIDTPGLSSNMRTSGMDQASVIVFVIDATKGPQAEDRRLYDAIKKLRTPIIVVLNKIDALRTDELTDQMATQVASMLGVSRVIPISARTGQNIAEELIPALIEASPEAALIIGRELPAYRRDAAQHLIRNASLLSLAAGLEPIPLVDIPILLGTQIRLVLRIAALYGEPMGGPNTMRHARELIVTMAGGLGLRYLAEQAAKAVPFGGDLIAGAIAAAATWSIGQVALEYYEGGKQVTPVGLRQLYANTYQTTVAGSKSMGRIVQNSIQNNGIIPRLANLLPLLEKK